jgi:hypothetical protein
MVMAILGRLRTVWAGVAGSPYYTNIHFSTDIAGTGAQVFCDAWTDFLVAHQTNFLDAMTCVVDNDVPLISDVTGELVGAANVFPDAVNPSGGGEALPLFTQGLISLETGAVVAGRRLRGRIFLPGMQETNSTSAGVPSGTLVAAINSSFESFLGADGAAMVVYSPTHHTAFSVVTGTMWNQWAILRSRRD